MPVAPPAERGATPSARHWRCASAEKAAAGRGNEAQATVLHSSANRLAFAQLGRRQAVLDARPKERVRVDDVNTP
jgi:hypothetical protein